MVGKGPPLSRSARSSEANPTMVGVPMDVGPPFVDHYLMVEPTESDQILRIGAPAL